MPNPFAKFNRPGGRVQGISPVTAGVSRGLTPPPNAPPLWIDTIAWYDGTDPSVNWQDVAGTIPAANGIEVDRVDDKSPGNIAGPASEAAQNPLHLANDAQISLPCLDNDASGFPIQWQGPTIGLTGAGLTVFATFNTHTVATSSGFQSWGIGGNFHAFGQSATNNWEANVSGAKYDLGLMSVGPWVWIYTRWDAAGNNVSEVSGGLGQVAGPNTAAPIFPAGSNMGLHGHRGNMGEVIYWPYDIGAIEMGNVISWADAKYGGPFPIP